MKNMDHLAVTITQQTPTLMKRSHRRLSLREATHLQSPAELIQVCCGCKGNCNTICCKCFKAKVECTLHCHGQNVGVQCTNSGDSAAPSGTFNLEQKTTPSPSHNHKRLRGNTQGEAIVQTYSTSVEDVNQSAEDNDDSDLIEQDIEEGEGLEEYNDVDEEEQAEEQEEDNVVEEGNDESDFTERDIEEGDGLEEYGNVDAEEEEALVSSQDMEHSVIVVAQRH